MRGELPPRFSRVSCASHAAEPKCPPAAIIDGGCMPPARVTCRRWSVSESALGVAGLVCGDRGITMLDDIGVDVVREAARRQAADPHLARVIPRSLPEICGESGSFMPFTLLPVQIPPPASWCVRPIGNRGCRRHCRARFSPARVRPRSRVSL